MLSVAGCMGIMLGTIGILLGWEEQQLARIRYLQEFYQLFRKGKYALVGRRQKCVDFFKEYQSAQEEVTEACAQIAEKLMHHEVAFGDMAWKSVWEEYMEQFHFSREEKEMVYLSGMAFFGKSMEEVDELFGIYQKQYEELMEKEKQVHQEKKKVVVPVGVLSGIMLIILLI